MNNNNKFCHLIKNIDVVLSGLIDIDLHLDSMHRDWLEGYSNTNSNVIIKRLECQKSLIFSGNEFVYFKSVFKFCTYDVLDFDF